MNKYPLVFLLFSAFICAEQTLNTPYGSLTITNNQATRDWFSQSYIFADKVIGYSEWMDVKAQNLGGLEGKDYIVLMASTGGNHCQDVVSFIEVGADNVRFSPSFDVCSGLDKVRLVDNTVVLTELEVEGVTAVQFITLDNELFNGSSADYQENYSFLRTD
ncbi:hypothetical protein [Vibrio sp. HN007]|uniref:hypothetical protein n=1 Tax=Vibrio iocasae TaxID=3098914 RepID=UPI0035D4C695